MSIFKRKPKHVHDWKIVDVGYHPPLGDVRMKWATPERIDEVFYGVTFVTHLCSGCGRTYQDRMLGRYVPPGWKYP